MTTVIDTLREAYEAATPGEWEFSFQCVSGVESFQSGWKATNSKGDVSPVRDVLATTYDVDDTPFPQAEANGKFIALAHNQMPQILAVLHAADWILDMADDAGIDLKALRKAMDNLKDEE